MNDFAGKLYIDGRWCEGVGGKRVPVINPATEREIAAVADGEVAVGPLVNEDARGISAEW